MDGNKMSTERTQQMGSGPMHGNQMGGQPMGGQPMGGHQMGGHQMGGYGNMMAMLKELPPGIQSPSGHYWCAMCKKMFEMADPICPYMPTMCVNTPVAIETLPPGSTAFYERVGLFYPKLVQRLLGVAVQRAANPEQLGQAWAADFLADLAEWHVQFQASPVETVKSFLIYTTGYDVATRNTAGGMTFYLMDAQQLWGEEMPAKKRSKAALLAGARRVAAAVNLTAPLDLHFMSVTSGKMGRYFCAQCSMFFEFGQQQSQVTCPFMPQKCKFRPKPISEVTGARGEGEPEPDKAFKIEILTKIYAVSPKLYRRQLASALAAAPDSERGQAALDAASARELLFQDLRTWGFDLQDRDQMEALFSQLGI